MARKFFLLLSLICLISSVTAIIALSRVWAGGEKPPASTTLPEGVGFVPADAMYFVHVRVADILAADAGKSLLDHIAKNKELAGMQKEAEKEIGLALADLESCTVFGLVPPGWRRLPAIDKRPFEDPFRDRKDFRWEQLKDFFKDYGGLDKKSPFDDLFKDISVPKDKAKPHDKPDVDKQPTLPAPGVDKRAVDKSTTPVAFQPGFPQHELPEVVQPNRPLAPEDWQPDRHVGVILTAKKPLDRKKLLAHFVPEARGQGDRNSILFLSDRSILLGPPRFLMSYADLKKRTNAPDPLQPVLKLAAQGKHQVTGGFHYPDSILRGLQNEPRIATPAFALTYPLMAARSTCITLDLDAKAKLEVHVFGHNTANARLAAEAVKSGIAWFDLNFDKLMANAKPKPSKAALELAGKLRQCLVDAKCEREGNMATIQVSMSLDAAAMQTVVGEVIAKAREAGHRAQSANNLKQLALAMHAYHDTYKGFPPPGISSPKDRDGIPLLSWRVAILPFIEQDGLYKQFNLDEPWDSPHNKKLIAKMPAIYKAPGANAKEGHTVYQVFVGPGTAFEPLNRGNANIQLARDITDGSSNTFMIVEAADPQMWTKPDDLRYDPDRPLPKLGGVFAGGFHAAMCDGSVRFIRGNMAEAILRAAITRNGGEILPEEFYEP